MPCTYNRQDFCDYTIQQTACLWCERGGLLGDDVELAAAREEGAEVLLLLLESVAEPCLEVEVLVQQVLPRRLLVLAVVVELIGCRGEERRRASGDEKKSAYVPQCRRSCLHVGEVYGSMGSGDACPSYLGAAVPLLLIHTVQRLLHMYTSNSMPYK